MQITQQLTSQAGCQSQWQVCKQSHQERRNQRYSRRRGDVVSPQIVLAQVVIEVVGADGVVRRRRADTWTSGVGQDGCIDTDDLGVSIVSTVARPGPPTYNMAAAVTVPARSSVKNFAPGRSNG